MPDPYIIRIASQKGGVGKTTISVNTAVILSLLGHKVLIVDCDAANPTIGFHLGMSQANIGYKEVLTGKSTMNEAIAMHGPSGLRVLPGTLGPYSFVPTPQQNLKFLQTLSKSKYDFIILDTSPGFSFNEPLSLYSEALMVTTPESSACTSVMRLARVYTEEKLKHNLVVNRVKNTKYEFSIDEIEDMYENRAVGVIPEDEIVPLSVSEHIPAYLINPKSNFSRAMKTLARRYSSRLGTIAPDADERTPAGMRGGGGGGLFGWIKKLLGMR